MFWNIYSIFYVGAHLPSTQWDHDPYWDLGLVLDLAQ